VDFVITLVISATLKLRFIIIVNWVSRAVDRAGDCNWMLN